MVGPLSSYLLTVCDELVTWAGDPAAETVSAVATSLREPLRVAVVGRVKAGKSTLVNALIGQRVAPTAATECTRAVTWYRYGDEPGRSAEVILLSGERRKLPFHEGLPDTLGVPLEDVDRVEVRMREHTLESLTLIDTPGLSSLTTELGDATRTAVVGDKRSKQAAGDVDAIVFVFRETQRQDEIDIVRAFGAATGELGASGMNAIGVLSHADAFGDAFAEPDALEIAEQQASRLAAAHPELFADVVPVAGLLAETSRCGRIVEPHAADLARLGALDDRLLQLALMRLHQRSSSGTTGTEVVGVSEASLRNLERLLGPYGVRHARQPAADGAWAVRSWCDARAGVSRLEQTIADRFTRRADALKAGKALATLERLSWNQELEPGIGPRLRDRLELVRREDRMHRLKELEAAEQLLRRPRRDTGALDALQRLLSTDDPVEALGLPAGARGDARAVAEERTSWAMRLVVEAAPDVELVKAARVLSISYRQIARRLS